MMADAAQAGREAAASLLRSGWVTIRRLATNDVLVASLALALLIIFFFYDVVFMGRTLVTSPFLWGVMGTEPPYGYPGERPDYNPYLLDPLASAVSAEPTTEKMAQQLRELEIPLWDANMALGRPLLASMDPSVVAPIRLPLMLSSTPEMWDAFSLVRFLVAGLFTYLLAKRLGLLKLAAFGAALAFAFSGYLMLYINMPHADSAMMIPLLLYMLELLMERPSAGRAVLAAVVFSQGMLVNNPQPALVLIAYGTLYYVARLVVEARNIGSFGIRRRVISLGLALTAGVGLTAFALVPFLELTGALGGKGLAVHLHSPDLARGIQHDPLQFLVSLFIPFFDGPPVQNFQGTGWTGVRNYVGVIVPLLAFIGVWNRPLMRKAGWFFLIAAVFLLAKTYGVPLVNWIGHLPLLRLIDFGLYTAPAVTFSLAMLAGLGLDQIGRGLGRWRNMAAALISLGFLLGWLVWLNRDLWDDIPTSHLAIQLAFAAGLMVIVAMVVSPIARRFLSPTVGTFLVVFLLAAELFVFTMPTKAEFVGLAHALYGGGYVPVIQRPHRFDPFNEPPYVGFLRKDRSQYRVFSTDRLLYPNTARAYDIDDIRGFTATTVKRYLAYIQNFINPSVRQRFTGAYLPPFGSEAEPPKLADNPLFDLLNVKYILTARGLPMAYDYYLAEQFLPLEPSEGARGRLDVFTINGEDDVVLFQHPISSLSYVFTPDAQTRFLLFRLALDPQVWGPDKGDGVLFRVSVRDDGSERELFSRWVDPKNNPQDRRWIDGAVDLGPYLGRPVTLVLSTLPGESGAWDWAGWGGLRLAPAPDAPPHPGSGQFELVYDGEVRIYENRNAFPRAFVVHRVEEVSDMEEAIARMKGAGFDPAQVAVIEGELPPAQAAALGGGRGEGRSSVQFVKYEDNEVRLRVRTERAGLLVLSDTYYPGWKAYVDGEKVRIYPTDVALRSVFLEPGEHEVRFVFAPTSFKIGSLISGLSLLALAAYVSLGPAGRLWRRLRRRGEGAR